MSNVEVARRMYDAFGRGDITAVLADMDPSVEWAEAEGNPYQMDGSAWVGPQAIVDNLFAPLGRDWDGLTVRVASLLEGGDHVIMLGRGVGTFRATGRKMDAQACHVLRFRNGKLVQFQQHTDTAQLQNVMNRGGAAK